MKDRYFYGSLAYTLIIYFILAGALISFVVITGLTGFLIILIAIVLSLIYFYKGFRMKRRG
jgi:4-hydroxybenzoate polyprenyltransferase